MKDSLPLYRDFSSIHAVDPEYYSAKYDVKRGLRNADGTGVLAGVTNISNVHGYVVSEGDKWLQHQRPGGPCGSRGQVRL